MRCQCINVAHSPGGCENMATVQCKAEATYREGECDEFLCAACAKNHHAHGNKNTAPIQTRAVR